MLPLAAILQARGAHVSGSDRAFDQGQTPEKFEKIKAMGFVLYPQDGSGITEDCDVLVVSSAVENTIPDVYAAHQKGISIKKRADILSALFNDAECSIGISGTSGKTTVTGMIAYVLEEGGYGPDVVNGGEMVNFSTDDGFGNYRVSKGDNAPFVAETDESDGSIALYTPTISVLNNIAQDHKSMEELESLFLDFIVKAKECAVLNIDNKRVANLIDHVPNALTYGIECKEADLAAYDLIFESQGVQCRVLDKSTQETYMLRLCVPGQHNVSNALAALCVAKAKGMSLNQAVEALGSFKGIRRRLEYIGTKEDVTIIDDFAHNPDKMKASLQTLKEFSGRLLIMFQPHGYAPLKMMQDKLIDTVSEYLDERDVFILTEPYYAGGTVDKDISSRTLVKEMQESGVNALFFENRVLIKNYFETSARKDDRVVIMGARDDTLSLFARDLFS